MRRAGFWKCDDCQVRWYGADGRCWVCEQPGVRTMSLYITPEVRA